jgi:tryptophan synthase beta subunit
MKRIVIEIVDPGRADPRSNSRSDAIDGMSVLCHSEGPVPAVNSCCPLLLTS